MHWKPYPRKRELPPKPRSRSAAHRATPEGQAEEEEVIRKVREEFPPLAIDPELAKALSRPAQNGSDRA